MWVNFVSTKDGGVKRIELFLALGMMGFIGWDEFGYKNFGK
jgi:hypothetical protein